LRETGFEIFFFAPFDRGLEGGAGSKETPKPATWFLAIRRDICPSNDAASLANQPKHLDFIAIFNA
jgi:hypothetical protein